MEEVCLNNSGELPVLLKKYVKGADCPTCKEGTLIGRRDAITFKFLAEDSCLLCGQPVIYETIDGLL